MTLTTAIHATCRHLGPTTGQRGRGGAHLYYGDDEARGNQNWQLGDCSGEVRGARGYLILHNGGAHRLARAIQSGPQLNLFPFPAELMREHEAELIVPAVHQLHAVEPHGQASLTLEGVYSGARNKSLFLVVRTWAYKQRRGTDLSAWLGRVRAFTLQSNERLPDPLSEREAVATGYSVATWVWSAFNEIKPSKGKGPLDHSSIAQSWRGTWSGEARRRVTADRDKAITKAIESGRTYRAVAAQFGLSVMSVWKIHKRRK